MTMSRLTLAAAASLLLSTPFLLAQAKPSPYEGVSTPPANDAINTTEQAPATHRPRLRTSASTCTRAGGKNQS